MTFDWFVLISSAVVLWLPAHLTYPQKGRDQLVHYHSAYFPLERIAMTWQHWLDLVRAFVATFCLTKLAIATDPDVIQGHFMQLDLFIVGGILVVGVLLQTVQYRHGFYFTAPVFYLWGITFALVDPIPAAFAILFSAIIARMFNHVELKMPLMAGLVVVVGYLVNGFSLTLILAGVLIVLPVVAAFAAMSHLVCYSRDLADR